MPLMLRVLSGQRKHLGDEQRMRVGHEGATIGRSLDNDWVLPDPKRYVSSRHATIDFQGGAYYLIDTSTNGVYVNGADAPVGAGKPQRLFNGDKLAIGDYEIVAEIAEADDKDAVDDFVDSIALATLDKVLAEDSDEQAPPLIEENELTGANSLNARLLADDDIDATSISAIVKAPEDNVIELNASGSAVRARSASDSPQTSAATVSARSMKSTGLRTGVFRTALEQSSAGASKIVDGTIGGTALESDPGAHLAFLRGLGITSAELGNPNSTELMHNAGRALREFILGMMDMLQTRASLKNTFRLEQTTIQAGSNNPLKFSANVEDAIRNLLVGQKRQFVPTVETIRQACADVKLHEEALAAAMRTAFDEFADRLEPEELQNKFDGSMKRGALFGGNKRSRYWELYAELYEVMTQRSPGQFPHIFNEDFAKAYEEYLRAATRKRRNSRSSD